MKQILITCMLLIFAFPLFAQKISSENLAELQRQEETLAKIGLVMIYEEDFEKRRDANYTFIKEFTKALKIPNSYEYDFPKLRFLQVVQPKDKTFRIFTWQIETVAQMVRHYGAIQENSTTLKLHPLLDRSDDMELAHNFVGNNEKWFGALYYDVQQVTQSNGHKKYVLFGLDTNTPISTKKVIDVLQFNNNGTPIFGAPIFPKWDSPKQIATRFLTEYRSDGKVSIKYNPDKGFITLDHLVPMREEDEGIYINYVPDGTFDSLKWNGEQFEYNRNVIFTDVSKPSRKIETYKKSNKKKKKKRNN